MTRKAGSRRDPVPPLEWAAAIAGLLVFLLLVGVVAWEAVRTPADPVPRLSVTTGRLVQQDGSYLLTLELNNAGMATAAAVQVEGTLRNGGEPVETSSASINLVPGNSRASGGLIFTKDPRKHSLDLRVTGYQVP